MKSNHYSPSLLLVLWAIATTFALNSMATNSLSWQVETANQSQFIGHRN